MGFSTNLFILLLLLLFSTILFSPLPPTKAITTSEEEEESPPKPRPWPEQFHALLWMNYSGSLSMIDLWYDWPNGRNFNIITDQLTSPSSSLYDLEWNNGTSFFYNLDRPSCSSAQLEVGILRPDWLVDGSVYLGRQKVDGFLCDVWQKLDFIWYYEDVDTKTPVHWVFYTGRAAHVMTFEEGAALEDEKWQAPVYCFDKKIKDAAESTDQYISVRRQQEKLLRNSFLAQIAQ